MRSYENPEPLFAAEQAVAIEAPKAEQSKFIVATDKSPGLDVSGELYRVYTYPGGTEVRVDGPQLLWVKRTEKGDSHRLALANGNGTYIAAGWLKIEWKNKPGQPPVAW